MIAEHNFACAAPRLKATLLERVAGISPQEQMASVIRYRKRSMLALSKPVVIFVGISQLARTISQRALTTRPHRKAMCLHNVLTFNPAFIYVHSEDRASAVRDGGGQSTLHFTSPCPCERLCPISLEPV